MSKAGVERHGNITKLLKDEHGVTHGYANLVADDARHGDAPAPGGDDWVAAQYAGTKAAMEPIYDKLMALVPKLGSDVELSPKKACISLRRCRQFASIQPLTATRIDVGIKSKGTPTTTWLEASGSFNAMVTNRVRSAQPGEVDANLESRLKAASDASRLRNQDPNRKTRCRARTRRWSRPWSRTTAGS